MSKFNLNVRISEEERKILEGYCEQSDRNKTDVIRALIRALNFNPIFNKSDS